MRDWSHQRRPAAGGRQPAARDFRRLVRGKLVSLKIISIVVRRIRGRREESNWRPRAERAHGRRLQAQARRMFPTQRAHAVNVVPPAQVSACLAAPSAWLGLQDEKERIKGAARAREQTHARAGHR